MFGKKKNSFGSENLVFTVFDKVSKLYRGTFYHSTDEEMIKVSLPSLLMEFPLRDIEIFCIGTFNTSTGKLTSLPKRKISTSCYLFPHSLLSSKGDDLSLKDLDKAMKEKKAELVAKGSVATDEKKDGE